MSFEAAIHPPSATRAIQECLGLPGLTLPEWTVRALVILTLSVCTGGFTALAQMDPQINVRDFGAVCNGLNDDAPAMQAALDALPATGGTLNIPCTLGIGASGVVLDAHANVTIRGTESGAGIRSLAPTTHYLFGGVPPDLFGPVLFVLRSCDACYIQDLTFDGNDIDVIPLGLEACSHTVVQNNVIHDVGSVGGGALISAGGSNNSFIGNTIFNTAETPPGNPYGYAATRGMWLGSVEPHTIEWHPYIAGNTLHDVGHTGIATHMVGGTVINNTVENTAGAGVKLTPPPEIFEGPTLVENNIFRNNYFHGIQINNGHDIILRGNLTELNTHAGIYVSGPFTDAIIEGNRMLDNDVGGPSGVEGGLIIHQGNNVVIRDNEMDNTQTGGLRSQTVGMRITAHQGPITGFVIENNISTDHLLHGILIQGSYSVDDVTVSSNRSGGNSEYGLSVTEYQHNAIQSVTVCGNDLSGNVLGEIDPSSVPISNIADCPLLATDGYDSASGATLVQNGELVSVLRSDDVRLAVTSGNFVVFKFEAGVPDSATVESVKVWVEHHEQSGIRPDNAIEWQIGTGLLPTPAVIQSFSPNLQRGQQNEAFEEWDVTPWAGTPAIVNDLKVLVLNHATVAKDTLIDRVHLEVAYSTANAPGQASTPTPGDAAIDVALSATLSWTAGSGATSHDVYFGTNPTPGPAELEGNQAGTTFTPGPLVNSTTYYWRIDEVNAAGTTTGPVWSFTTVPPPPLPGQASTPSPANAATDVSLTPTLSWTAGSDATSHDVYFGTNPTLGAGELQGNPAGTTFDPGTLASSTTYYWRIDEVNVTGTTTGSVWSFTTVPPPPLPGQASTPSPADAATDVSLTPTLSWTAGSDATSHDVYFGTNPTPGDGELQGNQSGTTFDSGTLVSSTTYYWRIDEVNVTGTTTGPVWSFSTAAGATDVVTITKANWKSSRQELKVWATSSDGGGAVLTVVGYGQMTFNAAPGRHELQVRPVPQPATVTVTSSQGGQATAPVTVP